MSNADTEDERWQHASLIDVGTDETGDDTLPFDSWWDNGTNPYSRSAGAAVASELEWDFVALISAVSQVYRSGIYLNMMKLDDETWLPLGQGATFRVSRSNMKVKTVTAGGVGKKTVPTRLVLKRNDEEGRLSRSQIRSFIKEIRVLDHMRHHPFIVSLRAIGWFDEYSPECDRYSKPGIILEEAFNTLDHLILKDIALPYPDLLRIFGQVTAGLGALHRAGVAHGDLKPGNILLFVDHVNRDNTQVEIYSVKISDFGSSVFEDEDDLKYSPGTKRYTAPEVESYSKGRLEFAQITRADTWSLGILFVVVLCRSFQILKEALEFRDVASRIEFLKVSAQRHLESSAASGFETEIFMQVVENTLQKKPCDRDLSTVEELLRPFVDTVILTSDEHLCMLPDKELYIDYGSLINLSGSLKDDLVRGLQNLTEKNDHRTPKALWELGTIYLTHFADPLHTISEGLRYVRESAQAGDIRAKALCYRLHDAFGNRALDKTPDDQRLKWVREAAEYGHQSAIEELQKLDPPAAVHAQAAFATRYYQCLDRSIPPQDLPMDNDISGVSERGDTPVHRAAATGRVKDLEELLSASDQYRNQTNDEGDTPLMAACRFGQFASAQILLQSGCDATSRNQFGENALHFIWCFNSDEGGQLARQLLEKGAKADNVSRRTILANELDVRPIVKGTPLERVVARGRDDLALVLLESGDALRPSNGRIARQLLFWTLAQPSVTLLDLVLTMTKNDPEHLDESLPSLTEGHWTHDGERRSLLDAVCSGSLSYSRGSYDVPMRLWLAVCYGAQWKTVLPDVISRWMQYLYLEIPSTTSFPEDSIQWAFDNSFHDAFMSLLHVKYKHRDYTNLDHKVTETLTWKPHCNMRVIAPQKAQLIDRIFYDTGRGGTMAHQALLKGDRYMFWILVHRYHANPALPIHFYELHSKYYIPSVQHTLLHEMSPYTALLYTKHRDYWPELKRLEISLDCPWDENPYNDPVLPKQIETPTYLPPLVHAIGNSQWAYALWLLENGASLEDPVRPGIDVLGAIMASRSRTQIRFIFQGCNATGGAAKFLPSLYNQSGGYHVLSLYFQTAKFASSLYWHHPKYIYSDRSESSRYNDDNFDESDSPESRRDDALDAYCYLLEAYPEAENKIKSTVFETLLGRSRNQSLIEQAVHHSVDSVSKLIVALQASPSGYPKQSLRRYLYGSSADKLSFSEFFEVMENCPGLTFRHFAPSILWDESLKLWVFPALAALGLGLLRWFIGPDVNYWNREAGWIWSKFPHIIMIVTLVLTVIPTIVIGIIELTLALSFIEKITPFLRPLGWAPILVLLNYCTPILVSVVLSVLALILPIKATLVSS